MTTADSFDLDRFVRAQADCYAAALAELRRGRKRTHWMWFVFPQMRGLGVTATSEYYGISGLPEARAYLAHPVLGPRLRDCTAAVLGLTGVTLRGLFGTPDDLKFRSSMTLFSRADEPDSVFAAALGTCCGGHEDPATLDLLDRAAR